MYEPACLCIGSRPPTPARQTPARGRWIGRCRPAAARFHARQPKLATSPTDRRWRTRNAGRPRGSDLSESPSLASPLPLASIPAQSQSQGADRWSVLALLSFPSLALQFNCLACWPRSICIHPTRCLRQSQSIRSVASGLDRCSLSFVNNRSMASSNELSRRYADCP